MAETKSRKNRISPLPLILLMAGEDMDFVPTYGRHPSEKRLRVES